MKKTLFLLPLLATSMLVVACTPKKVEPKIWELAEVEGESTIAQVKAGEEKAYYTVRGTVVGNSGSTLAIYRKGQFLYCYNFRAGEHENLQEHPLGAYVEIHAQSSKYSGSVQLTAYNVGENKTTKNEEAGINGNYDLAASLKVLEAEGEKVDPVALSTEEGLGNANAAGMLQKVSFVPDDDVTFTTNEDSTKETDQYVNGKVNGIKHDLKLEKFLVGDARSALLTANGTTFEAGATYEVVGMGAATSSGLVRTVLCEGASWRKTAEANYADPTSVVIGADGDPETIEKGDTLQLSFSVLPEGARQKVTWSSSDETKATVDAKGKVTAVELGEVTISAKSVQNEQIVGTYPLTVVKPAAKPLAEAIKFDFSARQETGTDITKIEGVTPTDLIKAATSEANAAHVTEATASVVYSGNANGGALQGKGFLRMGSSSAAGELVIKLDALVNKVEVKCHDWNKKSEKYPTTSNKLSVNGGEGQLFPYNEEGTADVLTFELAEDATNITLQTGAKQRGFIFEITVSYVAPTIA